MTYYYTNEDLFFFKSLKQYCDLKRFLKTKLALTVNRDESVLL